MAKSNRRKKKGGSRSQGGQRVRPTGLSEAVAVDRPGRAQPARRRPTLQNFVFALMLTLGCLGMAIFFTFFYGEDANHYLYSAIAALTGLGWLVIAVRRWQGWRG